jgi:galactitol-specific phosphotransferase system IIC component
MRKWLYGESSDFRREETMNYVLYVIGGAAILLACALLLTLFNRLDASMASTTGLAMTASLITGIGMCALGSVIGLLKKIARNTAKQD